MNINREVVIKRFERLEIIIEVLKEKAKISKKEFLKDITQQLSVQRAFVIATNICIDIGAHILTLNKNGKPETYGQIFTELEKLGIINKEIKDEFVEMVRFRNFLGHIYMDINDEIVYGILQKDVNIFNTFKKAIFLKFKSQLKTKEN